MADKVERLENKLKEYRKASSLVLFIREISRNHTSVAMDAVIDELRRLNDEVEDQGT